MNLFHYDRAREYFERATAMSPNDPEGFKNLGRALGKLERLPAAAAALERAFELDKNDNETRRILAGIYVKFAAQERDAGNRTGMIDYLHRSCRTLPTQTRVWRMLFQQWQKDSRWKEILEAGKLARDANRRAISIGDDADLQQVMVITAQAAYAKGDIARAEEYLRHAAAIKRHNDELIALRAKVDSERARISMQLREKGKALFRQDRFKESIDKLVKAESADPGSDQETQEMIRIAQKRVTIDGFLQMANDARRGGNLEEAVEHLQRAVDFAPEQHAIAAEIASITSFLDHQREEKARREARELSQRKLVHEKTRKFELTLKSARESEEREEFGVALINFQQALEMKPGDAEIVASIERVKQKQAQNQQKQREFAEKIGKAQTLHSEGKNAEAYGLLAPLYRDQTNPREFFFPLIIEVAMALEKHSESRMYISHWLENGGDEIKSAYFNGTIDFREGNYDKASENLYKVHSHNPGYTAELRTMIWRLRFSKYKWGIILTIVFLPVVFLRSILGYWKSIKQARIEASVERALASGDYEKIIPILEQRLDDGGYVSDRRKLTLALGEAYLRQGRYAEANKRAREVYSKDPKNAPARRIMGESCYQLGDTSLEALECIFGLYEMDETRKDLLTFMLDFYKGQQADHKQSHEVYSKFLALHPDDADLVCFLANLFNKRKSYGELALKVFRRAIKIDPDQPDFHDGYIQALASAGSSDEAEEHRQLAAKKWPGMFNSQPETRASKPGSGGLNMDSGGAGAPVPAAAVSADGNTIVCANCQASNSFREYYCLKCGKQLK